VFRVPDQLDQLHQTLELRLVLLHVHAPTIQDDDGQMMTVRINILILTDKQFLSWKGCIFFYRLRFGGSETMLCADGIGWGQFLRGSACGWRKREQSDAVNGYTYCIVGSRRPSLDCWVEGGTVLR
jgi:hypothetical protein